MKVTRSQEVTGYTDATRFIIGSPQRDAQLPDITGGVHVGELDVGAGDQGIMFGEAGIETKGCMFPTLAVDAPPEKKFTDGRKSGLLWWLRPEGEAQVTLQYLQ